MGIPLCWEGRLQVPWYSIVACETIVCCWTLKQIFEVLVTEFQRHRYALIGHFVSEIFAVLVLVIFRRRLLDQDLASALFKVLHFGIPIVEYNILVFLSFWLVFWLVTFCCIWTFLLYRILIFILFIITAVFIVSDVFSYKERVIVPLISWREVFFGILSKSHLLMVGWCENIFWLGFSGEFFWKDFTFNIGIWVYVVNVQRNAVSHYFSIQIITLNVFGIASW